MAAAIAPLATPALAQRAPETPPVSLQGLYACRGEADPAARLACYDRQVAQVAAAEESGQVRVVDEARRRRDAVDAFGQTILNREDRPIQPVDEISSTVRAASYDQMGQVQIVLENGQRWGTYQGEVNESLPAVGSPMVIRRTGFGDYRTVIGRSTHRVKRR